MCGLSGGISSVLSADETVAIHTLAMLSNLRGDQSTGTIFGVRNQVKKNKPKGQGRQIFYNKMLGNSLNYFENPKNFNTLWSPGTFLVATHTRFATQGDITQKNAHPFKHGHIIGMHNGTVPAYAPGKNEEGTDSERIIMDLADRAKGLNHVVSKAGNGAYALVWVDNNTGKLHIIRNYQRTLFITSNRSKTTYLWASEKDMLEFVCDRSRTPWEDPVAVEPETLYTFDLNNITKPVLTSYKKTYVPRLGYVKPKEEDKGKAIKDPLNDPIPFIEDIREFRSKRGPQSGITDKMSEVENTQRTFPGRQQSDGLSQSTQQTSGKMVEYAKDVFISETALTAHLVAGCSICAKKKRRTEARWLIGSTKPEYVCKTCIDGDSGWEDMLKPEPTPKEGDNDSHEQVLH